jgi:hypothetical protein
MSGAGVAVGVVWAVATEVAGVVVLDIGLSEGGGLLPPPEQADTSADTTKTAVINLIY